MISNLFGAALECSPPANAESRSFPAAMRSAGVKGRWSSDGGAGQLEQNADPCSVDLVVPDSSRSLRKVRLPCSLFPCHKVTQFSLSDAPTSEHT